MMSSPSKQLILLHVALAFTAALYAALLLAPAAVTSAPYDFDHWVQHVQNTCHPDPQEDPEDDDHLPSRPSIYEDKNFSKHVKEIQKKKKEDKKYGYAEPPKVSSHNGASYKKGRGLAEKKKLPPPAPKKKSIATAGPKMIVVAQDGSGNVRTVKAAIAQVPVNNKERIVIYVKKGIYREKVDFPASKPFITLKGESAALTYIEWGDTASTKGTNGRPLSTYGSASVAIESDNFIAIDISFKNTAPAPQGGAVGKQAVAVRVQGDQVAFYGCGFYGAQDTLYDRTGRHYYYKCYIEGSIDFIFGDARSLFVKCHLNSIANPFGSISAQKRTEPREDTGYSFVYCVVTGSGSIYLGRAWGAYSRVVYAYTYFDNIIVPQGWNDFGIPSNEKSVFYGEYKCFGPGADRTGRVAWSRKLNPQQARPFLSLSFIDGQTWIPK